MNLDSKNFKNPKPNLKQTLQRISGKFENYKKITTTNPVLKASNCWKIVSTQLEDILGREIHRQWFSNIRPLVVSDKLLILQTPSRAATLWINKNYQNLVDLLLSFQDKELSSFFICPCDISGTSAENNENPNG